MAMPDKATTRGALVWMASQAVTPADRAVTQTLLALADEAWAREEAQALLAADLANQAEREDPAEPA